MDETGLEKRIRTYANKAKVLTPVGSKQKRRVGRPSKKEMEYVALKTKRKKSRWNVEITNINLKNFFFNIFFYIVL